MYNYDNLSKYKVFLCVAECGSISQSAEQLYISQPAVSMTIKKLEESLGTTLFLRKPRGVVLTENGRLLYDGVKQALNMLSDTESNLKHIENNGRLRIAASNVLCKYLLMPYLQKFTEKYPFTDVSITCTSSANAHKMLLEMEKAPLIAKIEEQAPKVAFANAIGNSETLIYISELGKILKQNGVDIGERRLFEWLRDNGYLIKRPGQARNLPTQRSIELGIFKLIEKPYVKPSGERVISRTAMVTPKGQEYFFKKFLIPVVKGA